MTDLAFFDAFVHVGPRSRKHPSQPWRLDDVRREMEHCSIAGALVTSTTSITYDLMHENLRLSADLAPHGDLFAAWNVMPHQTGEFWAPDELLRQMRDHDVRAVMINPASNAWDWLADHTADLFAALAEQQVPAILRRSEFAAWRDLDVWLGRHPALPVILTSVHWGEQRYLLPLLRKHPNLHITFDHLQIHYGPEYLHEAGLTARCLYGSNAPAMAMGAHRCYIDYAGIPEDARAAIAGGNLIRLLKGQRPPANRVNADEDDLMTAARHGQPLPVPVLDLHMHILDEGMNCAGGGYRMDRGGPDGVIPLLERLGCVGGGFMSWNGTVGVDSLAGNRTVTAVLDGAPRGYWGLASFDPTHYRQDELARLIPAGHADPRFIGMKPYVHYGVAYDHPSYDVWWQYGAAHRLYALLHRTRNDYQEVDDLAERYPEVRWVVAHCGANYETADGVIESIRKHPNVYAEITLTPVTLGVIDYMVEHAGPDRIVYGSDLPMRDPRQQLGWVVFSRLSRADKIKVLCTNTLRVIQPCLPGLPEDCQPAVDAAYQP